MSTPRFPIFDAHLDLAYLALNKRDMLAPLDPAAPPHPPAAVTLDSLRAGNVRFALATIFTQAVESIDQLDAPEKYIAPPPESDPAHADLLAAAHRAARTQLEVYQTWCDRKLIALNLRSLLHASPGTGDIRAAMGVAEPIPTPPRRLVDRALARHDAPPISCGVLIENADPVRSPDELEWWVQRGVVAIGLAWVRASRYAGGNATTLGLTPLGRQIIPHIDRLRVAHDASHLSDRAFDELFDLAQGTIIASHSNVRALLAHDPAQRASLVASVPSIPYEILMQRHLSDSQIRRIVSRRPKRPDATSRLPAPATGVIGLNLYSKFLDPAVAASGRASIDACVRHIEHICDIAGDRLHVGLGTDMDGGFPADRLPQSLDSPSGLLRLFDALRLRNWTDNDLFNLASGNWIRSFAATL